MNDIIIVDEIPQILSSTTEAHKRYLKLQQIQIKELLKRNRLRQGISEELHKVLWGY